MATDTSIYANMLRTPKSALEWQDDYAARDDRAAARQMNALQLEQAKQAQADDAAYRAYVQGGGNVTTPEGVAGLGKVAPSKMAGAQKALYDAQKAQADIAKTDGETQKTAWDLKQAQTQKHLQDLIGVNDVAGAHAWLDQAAASGELKPGVAAAQKQAVASDPAQLNAWKSRMVQGGMTIMQQQEASKPKPEWQDMGGSRVMIDMNPNSPTFRQQLMVAQKTANPDALMSDTTTRRGQDMTAQTATAGQNVSMRNADVAADVHREANAAKARAEGADKPLNEGQSKALLFGSRAKEANAILDKLSAKNVERPSVLSGVANAVGLGSMVNSEDQQQVEQAQRDFINAVLRRESGAAIGASEFESAKRQYFPSLGDSEGVKAQKRANRDLAARGILAEVPEKMRDSLTSKPPTKSISIGGKPVEARQGKDGKYYVPAPGGKWQEVIE